MLKCNQSRIGSCNSNLLVCPQTSGLVFRSINFYLVVENNQRTWGFSIFLHSMSINLIIPQKNQMGFLWFFRREKCWSQHQDHQKSDRVVRRPKSRKKLPYLIDSRKLTDYVVVMRGNIIMLIEWIEMNCWFFFPNHQIPIQIHYFYIYQKPLVVSQLVY